MSDISDDKLEALLSQATPRPTPTASAEAEVRAAVHDEWVKATRPHARRRTTRRLALAAGLALVAIGLVTINRPAPVMPVSVAEIQKTVGAVYILGASSELTPLDDTRTIRSGQTVVSGDGSGIALRARTGGSLRLDENSEVKFTGANSISLRRGRVYYDSERSGLELAVDGPHSAPLLIDTPLGVVTHLGTQFMTAIDNDMLVVTVREGRVQVLGRSRDTVVESGKSGSFADFGLVSLLDVDSYGAAWSWASGLTPEVSVNGRTIHEFLSWAARELGYEVQYANADVQLVANENTLEGTIEVPPGDALRAWMSTTGIDWQVVGGVLYVGQNE